MKLEIIEYLVEFDEEEQYFLKRCMQKDGNYLWKIIGDYGDALDKNGHWQREPFPSNRTDEYLQNTRYKFDEALDLLKLWEST